MIDDSVEVEGSGGSGGFLPLKADGAGCGMEVPKDPSSNKKNTDRMPILIIDFSLTLSQYYLRLSKASSFTCARGGA